MLGALLVGLADVRCQIGLLGGMDQNVPRHRSGGSDDGHHPGPDHESGADGPQGSVGGHRGADRPGGTCDHQAPAVSHGSGVPLPRSAIVKHAHSPSAPPRPQRRSAEAPTNSCP